MISKILRALQPTSVSFFRLYNFLEKPEAKSGKEDAAKPAEGAKGGAAAKKPAAGAKKKEVEVDPNFPTEVTLNDGRIVVF